MRWVTALLWIAILLPLAAGEDEAPAYRLPERWQGVELQTPDWPTSSKQVANPRAQRFNWYRAQRDWLRRFELADADHMLQRRVDAEGSSVTEDRHSLRRRLAGFGVARAELDEFEDFGEAPFLAARHRNWAEDDQTGACHCLSVPAFREALEQDTVRLSLVPAPVAHLLLAHLADEEFFDEAQRVAVLRWFLAPSSFFRKRAVEAMAGMELKERTRVALLLDPLCDGTAVATAAAWQLQAALELGEAETGEPFRFRLPVGLQPAMAAAAESREVLRFARALHGAAPQILSAERLAAIEQWHEPRP